MKRVAIPQRNFHPRSGQALLEFAVIACVLTFLLAAILTFGQLLFGANVLQQAADVGAQELSRLPLPANAEFPSLPGGLSSTDPSGTTTSGGDNIFGNSQVQAQIFDEQYLVVDLDINGIDPAQPFAFSQFLADKPLINRLLQNLMIYDTPIIDGATRRLMRFPGAIVRNGGTGALTVLIPLVTGRDPSTGVETGIEWHAVVEEIQDSAGHGPFSMTGSATGIGPGFAALRINYPFQSAAFVAVQYQLPDGTVTGASGQTLGLDDVENVPVIANDGGAFDPPDPYELVVAADSLPGDNASSSGGRYGLGSLEAFATQVRPFRKVISAQGIYRREVVQ